jgi:hypothetical protein
MRSIEISTKTFAAIWAQRIEGEETENEILERLFTKAQPPKEMKVSITAKNLDREEFEMLGKIRWVDDIVSVLRELRGEACLNDIYDEVRIKRKSAGRSVTKEYKATIRRTLEDHSSDSANHRSDDLFKLVDRGIWALR